MSTTSKEDYIKTIYELAISDEFVKPSRIAQILKVSKPAITDMIKKLVRDDFVIKEEKGLKLSESGNTLAIELIRKHRLWETFLAKTLKMDWSEIHEEAENLEHATSNFLINKIDEFLDYPKYDPHGSPIPDKNGKITVKKGTPLCLKSVGTYMVSGIDDKSRSFIELMNQMNITLNSKISIVSKIEEENSLVIKVNGNSHVLNNDLCNKIYISDFQ